MKLRNRLAVATIALLVALPATALADPYTDPIDEEVLDRVEEGEVIDAVDKVEAVEVEAVSAEVVSVEAEAALAETGVSATMYTALAALLLAAGGLLLLASRRRKPTA